MGKGADFRAAVESVDLEAASACLAEAVEFHSPVAFKPFVGREAVTQVLGHVMEVFEDFQYVDDLSGPSSHMLRFRTRVGDRSVEGVDLLDFGDDGLIERFTVMLRPISATIAMAEAMAAKFEAAGGVPGK